MIGGLRVVVCGYGEVSNLLVINCFKMIYQYLTTIFIRLQLTVVFKYRRLTELYQSFYLCDKHITFSFRLIIVIAVINGHFKTHK